MKDHIDEQLAVFLYHRLEPFTIDELLEFLETPDSIYSRESLAGYLLYNQLAYVNVSIEGHKESWITRAGMFTNSCSLIRPTQQEIASGILIPGSRLVPFMNPGLFPHELTFTYSDELLPRIPVQYKTAALYPLYRFFGDEYTPQYLALDNESNTELFSGKDPVDPEECYVSAVDMKNVYWKESFVPGDMIQAKMSDWHTGIVELSVVHAADIDTSQQREWMNLMEESLVHVFEIFGPGASMDEQLSCACYLSQSLLEENNSGCLSDFIEWSDRVGIEPYGVETRLWYRETEIPAQGTWNMAIVSSPENPAEEAFAHLGLPITGKILDSYILDSLFLREEDSQALVHRLVPVSGTTVSFFLTAIENRIKSRRAAFQSIYNWFADHEQGTLRNRFVTLHNALMSFILHLQNAGITPNQIPDQGAVVLGQIMAHTISALEILSLPDSSDSGELESLWLSVEGMEDSFFETKTVIQDILPGLMKRRFSVIKNERNPDE